MRRVFVLCLVMVVLPLPLVALEATRLDLSLGYNRSREHGHLLAGALVSVPAGGFGIGAGARGYFGLGHEGQYVAPYLRVDLYNLVNIAGPDASDEQQLSASLYVGVGPVIVLQPAEDISDSRGGLMLLVGTQGPIATVGPGLLSLDLGLELSPPPPFRGSTDTGEAAIDGILGLFRFFLADAEYRWKISAGVTYSFLFD